MHLPHNATSRRNFCRHAILAGTATLAGCTTPSRPQSNPLVGLWRFDRDATQKELQRVTRWQPAWISQIMRAYRDHTLRFTDQTYEFRLLGKRIAGNYAIAKASRGRLWITFHCANQPRPDTGIITLEDDAFWYLSDEPLIKGVREHYVRHVG